MSAAAPVPVTDIEDGCSVQQLQRENEIARQ
jgi:hypothetical protein